MIGIVAVDENWGIGYKGDLLYSIPEDKKDHFKALTIGKTVVMGRATFDSLPNRKPLKNRVNIVLSRDTNLFIDSVVVVSSKEELFEILKSYSSDDVFIIGGQQIYKMLYNYCSIIYVTKIMESKAADRYFPNIDLLDNWEVESISQEKDYNGLKYFYYKYRNTDLLT